MLACPAEDMYKNIPHILFVMTKPRNKSHIHAQENANCGMFTWWNIIQQEI